MLIAANSESYTGWYVGLGIGFLIVVVVVILVATILSQASRIGHQALDGIAEMDQAREGSLSIWDLQEINQSASGLWRAAEAARQIMTERTR